MWQSHIELINDLYKIKQIQDSKLVEETIRNHESLYSSSRFEMFLKMGVLKIFLNLKGKHLSWSLIFNKVSGLQLVAASKCTLFSQSEILIIPEIQKYLECATSIFSDRVFRRCSVKKVFFEISQNSEQNTGARVSGATCPVNFTRKFNYIRSTILTIIYSWETS